MNSPTDTRLKIQAIDDDDDDLSLLEELLWEIPNYHITFQGYPDLQAGLEALKKDPGDLLFLDYSLEAKTGIEAFKEIQEMGYRQPVILLTGYGDEQTAVEAMKAGVADYLTKGTLTPHILQRAMSNAIEHYRLREVVQEQQHRVESADQELIRRIRSEKDLLEQTLNGSLEAMTHILSIMNPEVFSRSTRIKRYVIAIAKQLGLSVIWQLEIAALLSQIGFVTFPPDLLRNIARGKELSHQETELYKQYPQIGADMIRKIPRMEKVAEIIEHQEHTFDRPDLPKGPDKFNQVPLGSRILKVALDMDTLESTGHTKQQALEELQYHSNRYDPSVLRALRSVATTTLRFKPNEVTINDLTPPMVLADDIRAKSGAVVIPKGQPVTFTLLTRLHNFTMFQPIREPIKVLMPVTTLQEELELAGTIV